MTKIEITNRIIELMNYCRGNGIPWSEEEKKEFYSYFYNNTVNIEEGGNKYYNINVEPGSREFSTGPLDNKINPNIDKFELLMDGEDPPISDPYTPSPGSEGLTEDFPNLDITEYDNAVVITADYDPTVPEILKNFSFVVEFNSDNKITLMKNNYNAT